MDRYRFKTEAEWRAYVAQMAARDRVPASSSPQRKSMIGGPKVTTPMPITRTSS